MLVYDWLWWGQLTNQNHVRRCAELREGVHGAAQRCAEVCTEVRGGVRGVDHEIFQYLLAH